MQSTTDSAPYICIANITPELVTTRLGEIPADSRCLAFMRARAERARAARPAAARADA